MTKQAAILQFDLSPLAKAGVLVRNMQSQETADEHAISAPHRDKHCLLMLATHGRFRLNLDFEELAIAAPALLFVFPGQVHQVLEIEEPQGWAVSFDPALLGKALQLVLETGLRAPLRLETQAAFCQQASMLLALMEQVQSGRPDAYTGSTTHAMLNALLSLIAGQLVPAEPDAKPKDRRGVLLEQAFGQLLKQHYKAWKQPARYAAELAVSVAHLNDTVRGITGASLSAHIQQRAILEAKRLLCFTDLSIKEVGYAVGYDEPVYFGKLFRKVTGTTPRHFRQQFRD